MKKISLCLLAISHYGLASAMEAEEVLVPATERERVSPGHVDMDIDADIDTAIPIEDRKNFAPQAPPIDDAPKKPVLTESLSLRRNSRNT